LIIVAGTKIIAGLGSEGKADKRKKGDGHKAHLSDTGVFDLFVVYRDFSMGTLVLGPDFGIVDSLSYASTNPFIYRKFVKPTPYA